MAPRNQPGTFEGASMDETSLVIGASAGQAAAGPEQSIGGAGFNTLRVSELTLGKEGLEKRQMA